MSPRTDNKIESHERIRKTASRMIRKEGLAATSVHKVMEESGFTVGGFYAHFDNREHMIREAFETAAAERRNYVQDMQAELPPRDRAAHFVSTYLTQEHVADMEKGCMWAALLSELPRSGQATRELTSNSLKGSIEYFTENRALSPPEPIPHNNQALSPPVPSLNAREAAIASMAIAFAGLNLARMVTDPVLRDEILLAGTKAAEILKANVAKEDKK